MQTVGVIGLGLMGKPMASNLLKAGFAVTVFNRSRPAMDALAAEGATVAASPAEVGRASDVVVTMVPDSPDVEAVLLGPDGVCTAAKPGTLLIDMSTIAPAAVRRIHETVAAKGFRMLDAPVSGGDVGAKAGTLSIMVGGTPEDFERARPVFEAMGKTHHAVRAGRRRPAGEGVQPDRRRAGAERDLRGDRVRPRRRRRSRDHDPRAAGRCRRDAGDGGPRRAHGQGRLRARLQGGAPLKDLRIVIDEAKAMGLTLPTTSSVADMLATLVREGNGTLDNSSILTMVERAAGAARAARP